VTGSASDRRRAPRPVDTTGGLPARLSAASAALGPRVADTVRPLALRLLAPLATRAASRAGAWVDAAASRALAGDEAASQLAYVVEVLASEAGREATIARVLEHNLFLDGTFLAMVRPLLRGETEPTISQADVAKAQRTLATLLESLVGAATPSFTPCVDADDVAARARTLAEARPDLPLDALAPFLAGGADDDQVARFVLASYTRFLQTFLARSVVHGLPAAVVGHHAR